ncbi:MAG: hypothetical protein GC164_04730 [Phycisphaera sp.]|nr:hypothetical protein [Phycisphaera sp.]
MATPTPTIRALIIDGQNNHDWRSTTPVLRDILTRSGGVDVDVLTTPDGQSSDEDWQGFNPDFARYRVVVSNFTDIVKGKAWPPEAIDGLCDYVQAGGGFVAYHAAASAFRGHERFWRLIGVGWRDKAGHGPRFEFPVTMTEPGKSHPITRGLSPLFHHTRDELWHGLTGPGTTEGSGVTLNTLATAHSPITGRDEPVLWTVNDNKSLGRSFVTVLGHDTEALASTGFQTTFLNGCLWAANQL